MDAAGVDRADPEAPITLGNGAPAIHTALLAEARANPDAYKTIRAFPSGGSTKPPQLHDELMEAVPSSVGITSGYGMTEAPIVSQTDIDAPDDVEARRRRHGDAAASSSRSSTTASSS